MGRESRAETGESLAPEKGDRMTMGASVQWYSVETDAPSTFPECPWALQFTEETYQKGTRGDWNWETGMNRDQVNEFELIRDHGLRAGRQPHLPPPLPAAGAAAPLTTTTACGRGGRPIHPHHHHCLPPLTTKETTGACRPGAVPMNHLVHHCQWASRRLTVPL